jgi:isochorismate hydrolase
MSAYTDLQKNTDKKMKATDLEMCVLYCGDKQRYDISYINPEAAAAELAQLRERVEKLRDAAEFFCAYSDTSGEHDGAWQTYARRRWGEKWTLKQIQEAIDQHTAALNE